MNRESAIELMQFNGLQYKTDGSVWTVAQDAPGIGPFTIERRDGAYIQYTETQDTLEDAIASAEQIAPLEQWEMAEW